MLYCWGHYFNSEYIIKFSSEKSNELRSVVGGNISREVIELPDVI